MTDHGLQSPQRMATYCAAAFALIAWWALFHFHGVTDVGYLVQQAQTSAFQWLFGRWNVDWHGTRYAINFMAPLLALWLLWRRRSKLKQARLRVAWSGLFVLLLGIALHILGAKAQQTRLSVLAMVVLLWGIPWFTWGSDVGRAVRYPIFALVFVMPLNFFDYLLNPVRVAATSIAAAIAAGLGLAVKSSGSLLIESESGAWTLDLADATSGIFALLALVLWTIFLADLVFTGNGRRKFWLIAWTPILFLVATVARGLTLCLITEGFSPQTANALDDRYPAAVLLPWFLLMQAGVIRLFTLQWRDIKRRFQDTLKPQPVTTPPSNREGLP